MNDMVHTPPTIGEKRWPSILSLVGVYPVLLEYSGAGELTFFKKKQKQDYSLLRQ